MFIINNSEYFSDINIVKKNIYCFWTGNNEMSENRNKAFINLKENSKCNVILITSDNLSEYILPDYPLHEAYSYLSFTHRADYLRTYFMHLHGGGYSDIKKIPESWENAFNDINNDKYAYINGYRENQSGDIANGEVSELYDKLIGNGAYIVRPNTEFSKQWFYEMNQLLDKKLPLLKQMDVNDNKLNDSLENYPIEWNEMLGRIFHKLLANYIDTNRILYTVPYPIVSDYR